MAASILKGLSFPRLVSAAALAGGVKAAVEAKNKFHHDQIFRGVVLANVPDWLAGPETEAKRKAAVEARLGKLPELDAAVRKTLEMKPVRWEIVPAK